MGLAELFSRLQFLKFVELRPPKGVVLEELMTLSNRLHGRIDAIVVPDNADAIMAMDPQVLCRRANEQGHTTILHVNCRDRNRLGLQSHLLGAYADGIQNIAISRGSDPTYGDHPRAQGIYDVEPEELLGIARRFAQGEDSNGNPVEGSPRFICGSDLSFGIDSTDQLMKQAENLTKAGAQYFLIGPVHSPEKFETLGTKLSSLGVPIIAKIMLIKSVGMARYINRNVPGDTISDQTIKRLRKASDKAEESIRIAADTAQTLSSICRGVCFQPLGWEHRVPALLDLI